MKTRRCIVPQILATLPQADGGVPVAELCREHGMNNASFYVYGCLSHFKGLRPDLTVFPTCEHLPGFTGYRCAQLGIPRGEPRQVAGLRGPS